MLYRRFLLFVVVVVVLTSFVETISAINRPTTPATVVLDKCCPVGETLGTDESWPCLPSTHPLLHPFKPPPLYTKPGVLAKNPTYTLNYGFLPKCRLLYYLEPEREPAEVFWILESGKILRAGEGPIPHGNYCLEAIPSLNSVLPVLCLPEGQVEGVGVYAVYPVGMLVSIPFLATTILVYAFIKELGNLHGRCRICHVACLLFGYLCLAIIQFDTTIIPHYMCIIMGYAIQFFFMATFFWLNVMCFDIYWTFSGLRSLTGSAKERERKKLILYSLYAWGFPLLILLVTLGIDYTPAVSFSSVWKPNVGVDRCFFKDTIATGIYFYMPMGIVILVNIILFSITAFRICTMRRETSACLGRGDSRKHDNKKNSDRERFSLYFKLFLVMGINWVMEVVSFLAGGPRYLWYIPDFTNTLQGVFIFIIFVWKKRVRRLVWARLQGCWGVKPAANGTKSPWTASCRNTSSLTASSAVSQNSMKMQQISSPQNASTSPPPVSESPTKNNL